MKWPRAATWLWLYVVCVLGAFGLAGGHLAHAAPDDVGRSVAVLYPELAEPYRSVLQAIIGGIDERVPGGAVRVPLAPQSTAADLVSDLRRRDARVVVTLGRQGLRVARGLDRQFGVVASGVLAVTPADAEGLGVLSLAPDPGMLFARLRVLMPQVRRVRVVHDPSQNAWLIRLAREAARTQGLELVVVEATDLRAALRAYTDLLPQMNPQQEALWLPQDSVTVDEDTVMPLVLREAWERNLHVFSSNVAHVRRGVLFALYPDNRALGRVLGDWARGYLQGGPLPPPGVQPLGELLLAVNTRTARHLGVSLAATQLKFNTVFPEP